MKKYIPLQPQRDEIASIMKTINDCRLRVSRLTEDKNNLSSIDNRLTEVEDRLYDSLNDLGDIIGYTICSDIMEEEEVKL